MGFLDSKETIQRLKKAEKDIEKILRDHPALLQNVNKLRDELREAEKRSPEYEQSARQASKKTSEHRNRALDTLEETQKILKEAENKREDINDVQIELSKHLKNVAENHQIICETKNDVLTSKDEISNKIASIENKIGSLENIFKNHPNLEEEISSLEVILSQVEDVNGKSTQLLKSITTKKNEIDRLYEEIIGYTTIDEDTKEETYVDGLKDYLEHAYDGLDEKLNSLQGSFSILENSTINNYNNFLKIHSEKGAELLGIWEEKYELLNKKIESLLPNALTAGLSYAFTDKKKEEVNAYTNHKKQFSLGIILMITVSLIPFAISIFFLATSVDIDEVIDRVPRLVVAILPLYIPVLWLSISASKKMNLSKRLIEEYSHKEVLSKTFEGLSKQVQNLGEENISNDLKIKLLQNFLEMYSENPGKLISDYNKSDHPVTEIIENSSRLGGSLEKLSQIPGFEKLLQLMEKRAKEKLSLAQNKVEDGLKVVLPPPLQVDETSEV